jgi:threonine aldolase
VKPIDLRSDTVTRPTAAMRAAMAGAEVGDDVFGEDPTVNRLEGMAAELLAKEAALFVASGTQGNLIALLAHCGRGDEYIAGSMAHCYRWEGGGAAVFGGIQPQPVEFEPDGTLDLAKVEAVIKPVDDHYARTRLICLENTQAGKPLPQSYLQEIRSLAQRRGLALHMDGARLFNAAVSQNLAAAAIASHVDSINVCLSKGLGAPVGSVLCGSRDFIREARHWRKMAGGGMRQAGMLAAAGIHALQHHIERLAEDHANATLLAEGLAAIEGLEAASAQTNMVFVTLTSADPAALELHLKQSGVLVRGGRTMRLVTHLDIDRTDIEQAVAAFSAFFSGRDH